MSYSLQSNGLEDSFLKGIRCSGNCSSSGLNSRGNVCQCTRSRVKVLKRCLGNVVFCVPCCMENIFTEPLSNNGRLCMRCLGNVFKSRCLVTGARSDIWAFRRHAAVWCYFIYQILAAKPFKIYFIILIMSNHRKYPSLTSVCITKYITLRITL
jgi:hypothetical protein